MANNDITEKQKYALWVIEEYFDQYEHSVKFTGNTKQEATDFISEYYEEAKKNKIMDDAMFDIYNDPWGN